MKIVVLSQYDPNLLPVPHDLAVGLARAGAKVTFLSAVAPGPAIAGRVDWVQIPKAEGLAVTNLHTVDFKTLDALVLSPGVPLTHPEPHWTVVKAKQAGIDGAAGMNKDELAEALSQKMQAA